MSVGDYEVDTKAILGYGDGGTVYLGQHRHSRIFVAAKSVRINFEKGKDISEVQMLKKLGRLYQGSYDSQFSLYTLIMPLVDGQTLSNYIADATARVAKTDKNSMMYFHSCISNGIFLWYSLIAECQYAAAQGIAFPDPNLGNMMVSYEGCSVVAIDWAYPYDLEENFPRILSERFDCTIYAQYVLDFIGLTYLTDETIPSEMRPIVEALRPKKASLDWFFPSPQECSLKKLSDLYNSARPYFQRLYREILTKSFPFPNVTQHLKDFIVP